MSRRSRLSNLAVKTWKYGCKFRYSRITPSPPQETLETKMLITLPNDNFNYRFSSTRASRKLCERSHVCNQMKDLRNTSRSLRDDYLSKWTGNFSELLKLGIRFLCIGQLFAIGLRKKRCLTIPIQQ